MSVTENDVVEALRTIKYPGFTRDIVSFGVVQDVRVLDGRVAFRLQVGPGNPGVLEDIERVARQAVEALAGVASVDIHTGASPGAPPRVVPGASLESELLPGVRHTVAVASGKGGVGKSTVAVNLAVALARRGVATGLLDADVYGPSIPLMMGTDERPRLQSGSRRIVPFERYGVRFMSLGFLVDKEAAVIWRGPMVMKALTQLLGDVAWGPLDVLVVDLPPGTGDAQLTLSQKVRLAGAIIVTTPQDVALADAIKGVAMFRKVDVPILGMVENMSEFTCPHCGGRSSIFGHGGGKAEALRLSVPFLGELPLDPAIRAGGDTGTPVVAADPTSVPSLAFLDMASSVLAALGEHERAEQPSATGGLLGWLRRGGAAPEGGA